MTARRHRAAVVAPRPEAWRESALCARTDPTLFHPEEGQTARRAKKVCSACPVRAECLAHALAMDEPHGIWGGMSVRERNELNRQAKEAAA